MISRDHRHIQLDKITYSNPVYRFWVLSLFRLCSWYGTIEVKMKPNPILTFTVDWIVPVKTIALVPI